MTDVVALGSPSACAGCGGRGPAVCAECAARLQGVPRVHVPAPCPSPWLPLRVVADYGGTTRSIISAWKERGRRDAAGILAAALASAIVASARSHDSDVLNVVPIPSSHASRRRRGEDAWERVARLAVDLLVGQGHPARVHRGLRLQRQPRDQAGLTAVQRYANLQGALAWDDAPTGPIVVVDDVVTTGATLAEAARALLLHAPGDVSAAAIAATSRRGAGGRPAD